MNGTDIYSSVFCTCCGRQFDAQLVYGPCTCRITPGSSAVVTTTAEDNGVLALQREIASLREQLTEAQERVKRLESSLDVDIASQACEDTTRELIEVLSRAERAEAARDMWQARAMAEEPSTLVRALERAEAAERELAALKAQGACEWVEDSDGNWHTGCGHMAIYEVGTPHENCQRFCCYCGHPLSELRYVEPPIDDEAPVAPTPEG
jgi:hypothetical protein